MNEILLDGLNKQINKELYSAYLYFGMSTYFLEINMEGFAKKIKEQAKEEIDHAKKIYNYLLTRDEKISLFQIEAPDMNWINPIDAIKNALAHEKNVSKSIEELYKISKETNDYATEVFLQWFVFEQIEEEDKFKKLLDKMKSTETCDCEIIHIDRDLRFDKEYIE